MSASSSDFRSKLSRAKGLGTAHHGAHHWWIQRVTALALIPLSTWFVYSLMLLMVGSNTSSVTAWFSSPCNAVLMSLLMVATFWHAMLGLQVVIEDYVHAPFSKYLLLLANTFFCFGFGAVSILAVLKLHFQISL